MFIRTTLLLLLSFATIIQCQIGTNIETCSCDLTKGTCDTACCCDPDCSINDMKAFNCDLKTTMHSTCFKDLSIYKSNSPHTVQKKGDLVCVDHERNIDDKMINTQIDPSTLPRSINFDNSVSSPAGTATDLSVYEPGTSVFRYIPSTSISTYYTLPVKLFNSQTCGGSQPITYLNSFSSTCSQTVTTQTCANELDTTKYLNNNFCLVTLPSTLALNGTSTPSTFCCNGNGSASALSGGTCTNALQNLALTIYYSNSSTGIVNCTVYFNTINAAVGDSVLLTLRVNFLKAGSTVTTTRSGNPGYLSGASIIAGNLNGNSISTISTGLTILQALSTGVCSSSTTGAKVISFGQNVQSTCQYNLAGVGSCPDITAASNIFMLYNFNNLRVAGKGSSDPTNSSDSWITVQFCTSKIGSSNAPVCQITPTSTTGQCYIRLDVEIVFANFGSITNPQPIIGAVVYNFQSVDATTVSGSTTLLMTQTVTFQDVSVSQGDQVPRPNVRLPGDFFYPFTLNRAATPIVFSSVFYLLIFVLFFVL